MRQICWLPFDTHGGPGGKHSMFWRVLGIIHHPSWARSLSCFCPPGSFMQATAAIYTITAPKSTTTRGCRGWVGLACLLQQNRLPPKFVPRSFLSSYTSQARAGDICFPGASMRISPTLNFSPNNAEQKILASPDPAKDGGRAGEEAAAPLPL
jgi:hypothetical protein